jgi:hypothetical protein
VSVVLATTTITIETASEVEPGDGRTFSTLASSVPAQIGRPSGVEETVPGGGRQQLTADFSCDYVAGVDHLCRVTDEVSGEVWEVSWVKPRVGLGLDHWHGQLVRWQGGGR